MPCAEAHQRSWHSHQCAFLLGLIIVFGSAVAAQNTSPVPSASMPGFEGLKKYPGLLPEFGQLVEKLENNVKFPPARNSSRLLPMLPATTTVYFAFPNYGEATHQSVDIFQQELKTSPVLADWWAHGDLAATGPKIEDALDKFYRVSQYLGDEIVVSAAVEAKEPKLLIVAEVRRQGLKPVLEQVVKDLVPKSNAPVRVLDPQELASYPEHRLIPELLVLVRSDVVIASSDAATLRSFTGQLDRSEGKFATTPFGQRILEAYSGGVTTLGAADLRTIVGQVTPPTEQVQKLLQTTGFSDVKYLIWQHSTVAGRALSQSELSFTGPRRGIAGWLAAPSHLGSLDFVAPNPVMVASFVLNSPPQIFEQVEGLASATNPMAAVQLAQTEQALGISLEDDLFRQLAGEVTVEVDSTAPPQPAWKLIVRVSDAAPLQRTLGKLAASAHATMTDRNEGGITYYLVQTPGAKESTPAYAFIGNYLVVASNLDSLKQAVRLHTEGGSLGQSGKFAAALPPRHPAGVSALVYQDPVAMGASQLKMVAPELADALSHLPMVSAPTVVAVYGDTTAIREASTSSSVDASAVLVVAAIAIPNLLRSRMAANEASAVGSMRTIDTAQVTYAASYPDRGFAADLATLGPGTSASGTMSAEHAGLLDPALANASCTAGHWCERSGYRFTLKAICGFGQCRDFVAIATPANNGAGVRNFCSTSDAVIRFNMGPPPTSSLTVKECHAWRPLK